MVFGQILAAIGLAGFATSVLRRFGLNIQKPIIERIKNPLNQALAKTAFDASNKATASAETVITEFAKSTTKSVMDSNLGRNVRDVTKVGEQIVTNIIDKIKPK